jgi:hypothetical protein
MLRKRMILKTAAGWEMGRSEWIAEQTKSDKVSGLNGARNVMATTTSRSNCMARAMTVVPEVRVDPLELRNAAHGQGYWESVLSSPR